MTAAGGPARLTPMRGLPATSAALVLSLCLGACASPPSEPPEVRDVTTLHRFDGAPLKRRDIEARKPSALALSRALMRLERELREPWAEDRDATVLMEQADRGGEMRVARELWRLAEPLPRGLRRSQFGELGFYADASPSRRFLPPITPADLEGMAAAMLAGHHDRTQAALLLAAWRRFSPEISGRRDGYLASRWSFACGGAELVLNESLLGPHSRSSVGESSRAFLAGPASVVEGYSAPEGILALVAPGAPSPVQSAIDALAAQGNARIPVEIEGAGLRVELSEDDRRFLAAALNGLKGGCCEVAALPLGCTQVEVEFDYLVGNAEARSTLRFTRRESRWVLDKLVYEPAAAAVVGREGATLDLISLLRDERSSVTRPR